MYSSTVSEEEVPAAVAKRSFVDMVEVLQHPAMASKPTRNGSTTVSKG